MPLVSIQLNSNRPEQILRFFDSIEETAQNPRDIEVLLHIDTGDTAMEALTEQEKRRRKFTLKILQTDLVKGYGTLWMPLNPLFALTDPDAYFVLNVSDEMLFVTEGWDAMLRPFIGYYPDHIFRLRASKYRYRNYTDFWECGFAPDSLAFYTRRWLELQGDWNPCLGPDSFQQCVAFHLYTSDPFSHRQFNRDIPLPFMSFHGEGASIGLEGDALFRRMCVNNRAWFTLMSHRIQQEAKRRAMLLKATIVASGHAGIVEAVPHKRAYIVRDEATGRVIERFSYKLSRLRIALITLWRAPQVLYYAGGGQAGRRHNLFGSIAFMLATFTLLGPKLLDRAFALRHRYRHLRGMLRHHGPLPGLFTFLKTSILALMPPSMQDRLRPVYRDCRRRMNDRYNHIRGVAKTHGIGVALIAVLHTFFLVSGMNKAAAFMRQLLHRIHYFGSRIRARKSRKPAQGSILENIDGSAPPGCWMDIYNYLYGVRQEKGMSAPYTDDDVPKHHPWRDRLNHVRGVIAQEGLLSAVRRLWKEFLDFAPPPSPLPMHETIPAAAKYVSYETPMQGERRRWIDTWNHVCGVFGEDGFLHGGLRLWKEFRIHIQPAFAAPVPAPEIDRGPSRHFLHDTLNHTRNVLEEEGTAQGWQRLRREFLAHITPAFIKNARPGLHHTKNHIVGSVRYCHGLFAGIAYPRPAHGYTAYAPPHPSRRGQAATAGIPETCGA